MSKMHKITITTKETITIAATKESNGEVRKAGELQEHTKKRICSIPNEAKVSFFYQRH